MMQLSPDSEVRDFVQELGETSVSVVTLPCEPVSSRQAQERRKTSSRHTFLCCRVFAIRQRSPFLPSGIEAIANWVHRVSNEPPHNGLERGLKLPLAKLFSCCVPTTIYLTG